MKLFGANGRAVLLTSQYGDVIGAIIGLQLQSLTKKGEENKTNVNNDAFTIKSFSRMSSEGVWIFFGKYKCNFDLVFSVTRCSYMHASTFLWYFYIIICNVFTSFLNYS